MLFKYFYYMLIVLFFDVLEGALSSVFTLERQDMTLVINKIKFVRRKCVEKKISG